ncbi:MAG: pilus assembly protein PilM [bacterium]
MFERVLGIIIDADRISLCQVNKGVKSVELTHALTHSLPAGKEKGVKEIGARIRDLCVRNNIQPDVVYSAVPCSLSMFRRVHLPFTDPSKVARVYPFEIEQTLPCALDEVVMDFQIIARDRSSGTDLLVAILPKRILDEHLAILDSAGIAPRVTTLTPAGLMLLNQAFLHKKEAQVEGIIELEQRKATMVVVCQKKILFTRELDWDEKGGDVAHLTDQIELTLTAFRSESGLSLERLVLIGDYAHTSRLDPLVSERLGIKPESLASYKALPIRFSGPGPGRSPFSASTLGLCFGTRFKRGEMWNFRQGEHAFQKTYTIPREKVFALGFFALFLVVLGSLSMAARSGFYTRRLSLLDNEAQRILSQTMPNARWGPQIIPELKKALEKESTLYEQYKGFFDQGPNVIDLLRELSIRIPKEYDILVQEIVFQQDRVRVKGRVETFELFDRVKNGLSKSRLFQEIRIEEANIKGKGNQVSFNIILELKGAS